MPHATPPMAAKKNSPHKEVRVMWSTREVIQLLTLIVVTATFLLNVFGNTK